MNPAPARFWKLEFSTVAAPAWRSSRIELPLTLVVVKSSTVAVPPFWYSQSANVRSPPAPVNVVWRTVMSTPAPGPLDGPPLTRIPYRNPLPVYLPGRISARSSTVSRVPAVVKRSIPCVLYCAFPPSRNVCVSPLPRIVTLLVTSIGCGTSNLPAPSAISSPLAAFVTAWLSVLHGFAADPQRALSVPDADTRRTAACASGTGGRPAVAAITMIRVPSRFRFVIALPSSARLYDGSLRESGCDAVMHIG